MKIEKALDDSYTFYDAGKFRPGQRVEVIGYEDAPMPGHIVGASSPHASNYCVYLDGRGFLRGVHTCDIRAAGLLEEVKG